MADIAKKTDARTQGVNENGGRPVCLRDVENLPRNMRRAKETGDRVRREPANSPVKRGVSS